jgi:hypothetical protein
VKHKKFLEKIKTNPESIFIVHYSCESLNDDKDSLSAKITSISVLHYSTGQTISFSTHAIAEEKDIPREKIKDNFEDIEKELLSRFFKFSGERNDVFWVHWNMDSLTYGFEHLEHRFKCLTKSDAPIVRVESRINLSHILSSRYGDNYVKNPKMANLVEANGGLPRNFLLGKDEPAAFENEEFLKLHKSVVAKVAFFKFVIEKMYIGQLKVQANGVGRMLDRLFESRVAKAIGFIASIIAIPSLIIGVISII